MNDFEAYFKETIEELKTKELFRDQDLIFKRQSNNELINFSSNDYLGLAFNNPSIDIIISNNKQSAGTGSRLISGTSEAHRELEETLAKWKGTEAAIVFNNGYAANIGALSSIVSSKDAVFVDEYAHSCIWDGLKLSSCRKYIFKHNDTQNLNDLLEKHRSKHQKSLIIAESVFSMDGDSPELSKLVQLAEEYNSNIYIDEAHSTGIEASTGAGFVKRLYEEKKIQDFSRIIQMGTLSKAVAAEGGYICGSKNLIEFLQNKARTYIYSTAMSPIIAKLANENIKMIQNSDHLKKELNFNIGLFRNFLVENLNNKNNFKNFNGPIFTFFFGDSEKTIKVSNFLIDQGFICTAIRPPTVKEPRLRICINSKHRKKDIENLAKQLCYLLNKEIQDPS